MPVESMQFPGHATHSWRCRPAGSHKLTAQQRPGQWTLRTFSPFGRSLYRLNHLKYAHNIYRKRVLWTRCLNDGDETRDRPRRAVLRGDDGTMDHTSGHGRRHERTNGPAAASPPSLDISRGTIRWPGRMSKEHGRRTRAEHGDGGARRNMAKMGLFMKNYFRPILHPCVISLRYLRAQGVV